MDSTSLRLPRCSFCNICRGQNQTKALFQDEHVAVFHDRKPAAEVHLLVIPLEHIANIKHLKLEHLPLLKQMRFQGERMLREMYPDKEFIFGFHFPPSIGHLHLHCITLPLHDDKKKFKYLEEHSLWNSYDNVIAQLQLHSSLSSCPPQFR